VARESSQPHVVARGSSQPHVVARGSSQPHVVARESSQPHVVAWESSQPHVEAWESSQPHVEAWGSSQPHVVARGSSQPHVVARESSQPHVVAWGYVQAQIQGAVNITADANVSIVQRGTTAKVEGGRLQIIDLSTPAAWCDFYGAAVSNGVATLYKAVDGDYSTGNARRVGISYAPGQQPEAPDWDGGIEECGGGLHASPHPQMAKSFNPCAVHAVACLVRLEDIVVHPDGDYPDKVKFRGCCRPVYEVDWDGKPIDGSTP
ncbi:MAG: hypothetical protein P4M09_07770, partial [Devosia sp.]|nr:hypothetical protein [Devosia sp.]